MRIWMPDLNLYLNPFSTFSTQKWNHIKIGWWITSFRPIWTFRYYLWFFILEFCLFRDTTLTITQTLFYESVNFKFHNFYFCYFLYYSGLNFPWIVSLPRLWFQNSFLWKYGDFWLVLFEMNFLKLFWYANLLDLQQSWNQKWYFVKIVLK